MITSLGPIFHDKVFEKIELNFANSEMKFEHYQSLIACLERTNCIISFKLNLSEFPIILDIFFLIFIRNKQLGLNNEFFEKLMNEIFFQTKKFNFDLRK